MPPSSYWQQFDTDAWGFIATPTGKVNYRDTEETVIARIWQGETGPV
jgi:hypothetical protein